MLHEDRVRAESFGADPERYDRARPGYPARRIDDLLEGRTGAQVLDIGSGTGIVSRLFVDRGCSVLGVEPDRRMAELARARGLVVEEAHVEEWAAAGRSFDLVVCGQAWHWVEPEAATATVASVLRPHGRVGIFWNQGTYSPELRRAFDQLYRRLAPGLEGNSILLANAVEERVAAAQRALSAHPRLGPVEIVSYHWTRVYSTEQWLDQLVTHSDHRTLPADQLDAVLGAVGQVIGDRGGRLAVAYTTWLVTAVSARPAPTG